MKNNNFNYPILTSAHEGLVPQSVHFGSQQRHDTSDYNVIKPNQITYRNRSDDGRFTFNINRLNIMGLVSKFYPVFSLENTDNYFIVNNLNNNPQIKYDLDMLSVGTGQHVLSFTNLKKYEILAPSYVEQKRIGQLLLQLDNTITLHEEKKRQLERLKSALLQKMFADKSGYPAVRFEGFSDEWVQRKLGDVVGEIQSGNRLPKDSLTNGDVPYVVAQTKNDGVFKKIARGTLDYNGNPMKLFPGNSISFSIDNPEAMFYRSAEFYTSNIMRVIHEDHLTREQYVFILENMKRFIRGYDWSRKFSGPVVSNLEYLQPSEEEQQKIGSFFKQLDDTIALHHHKIDNLKRLKQALLQKMFI